MIRLQSFSHNLIQQFMSLFSVSPGQLSETLQLWSSARSSYPTRIVCSPCQLFKCCRVKRIQVHVLRDTFPLKVMVMFCLCFCLAVTSTLCFLLSVSLPPSGWPHPPLQHFFLVFLITCTHLAVSIVFALCVCLCATAKRVCESCFRTAGCICQLDRFGDYWVEAQHDGSFCRPRCVWCYSNNLNVWGSEELLSKQTNEL